MMRPYTPKQIAVLKTLVAHPAGLTPTEIGQLNDKPYYGASAWANSALKRLISDNLVTKTARSYMPTKAGRSLVAELNEDAA